MFNKLKMFKDLKNVQDQLSQESVTGTAEMDKIKVTIDGKLQITSVEIDPELLNPENKENIERGIKSAANDAAQKAQQIMADKIRNSNIELPGM